MTWNGPFKVGSAADMVTAVPYLIGSPATAAYARTAQLETSPGLSTGGTT